EAVEAVALLEAGWEQLRGRAGPAREEGPDAPGIMPEVLVLLSGHGQDDLLGPARRLRRGGGSFTMDGPGVRSGGHLCIPFPGKKKDAKKAAGRIPGTTSNTCNSLGSAFFPAPPRGGRGGLLGSFFPTDHQPPTTGHRFGTVGPSSAILSRERGARRIRARTGGETMMRSLVIVAAILAAVPARARGQEAIDPAKMT